eukprot:CAMPEP_0172776490 /NCGR_PEP_ID=MMETSP1074-20121228/199964_1 /TAXON_ID=2916 /ORGANISM="Ceratium fusus, Strain PA161109" /LENGTH=150 /DNA_ID=CAMNT_0013613271 /DNA_START=124 /DNA_END=572 /DNA_ORIENTATION=-
MEGTVACRAAAESEAAEPLPSASLFPPTLGPRSASSAAASAETSHGCVTAGGFAGVALAEDPESDSESASDSESSATESAAISPTAKGAALVLGIRRMAAAAAAAAARCGECGCCCTTGCCIVACGAPEDEADEEVSLSDWGAGCAACVT